MAAADSGLGLAGGKLYAATSAGATFVVCLFDSETSELVAVIEADRLGQLRTGAASGVAARAPRDERRDARSASSAAATRQRRRSRASERRFRRSSASSRTAGHRRRLAAFCERTGAEAGESHRDAGGGDIVVTITSSRDPVLRGEWLAPGALVCAAGANVVTRRELDNAVLERATFVCCDWLEQAKLESGDLVEPDRRRASSTGSRCTSCTRSSPARSPAVSPTATSSSSSRTASRRGTSRSGRRRCGSRASAASGRGSSSGSDAFADSSTSPQNASMTSGRSSNRRCCSGRQSVLDVLVVEDLARATCPARARGRRSARRALRRSLVRTGTRTCS